MSPAVQAVLAHMAVVAAHPEALGALGVMEMGAALLSGLV
jgi:hypothetical protein